MVSFSFTTTKHNFLKISILWFRLFKGIDKFNGKLIHTQQYKDSRGFEDKRVLVVGIGNSAADAAVDISDVTRQVGANFNSNIID